MYFEEVILKLFSIPTNDSEIEIGLNKFLAHFRLGSNFNIESKYEQPLNKDSLNLFPGVFLKRYSIVILIE